MMFTSTFCIKPIEKPTTVHLTAILESKFISLSVYFSFIAQRGFLPGTLF